jgi:hypothetical protein
MQTIKTNFLPITNTKGARVKATAEAGSITIDWDDSLLPEENHSEAAIALCHKFKWTGELVSGCYKDNYYFNFTHSTTYKI